MKKTNKKLSLNRDTVRVLDVQLASAAGGWLFWDWTLASQCCGSGVNGCSTRCDSAQHLTCPAD